MRISAVSKWSGIVICRNPSVRIQEWDDIVQWKFPCALSQERLDVTSGCDLTFVDRRVDHSTTFTSSVIENEGPYRTKGNKKLSYIAKANNDVTF
ncbi:uncharacterized protein PHALS_13157 [Plasmopara halstedii]|uniref:Uncharacterized protein n=1 Tax=Plasmopara halstedii TaxID=4781 RepID=A0A0P1APY5_PLAHL|nr:uncharacterized protein PHALS_13157 [Plasmopara halstedii]CEG42922.1 hypothetical protein PHALS_13157 [Plasmopara halstedii]|eukprot:XP_024579291.1 hypothetical protein PHALS_13157 [Plasmopara halstedii]